MGSILTIDDLQFDTRWSPRRKTLEITVDRGGELILAAPQGCDLQLIEAFVREKKLWIYKTLAEKDRLQHPRQEKELVSGESFPYLGRHYRLLLVDEQDSALKLEQGRFKLQRAEAEAGRKHFVRWYTEHAQRWLRPRVSLLAARVGAKSTGLEVRELGHRWGSCGKGGRLYFHWLAILLPPSVVKYVILHELVHLLEPHHTPAFWQRVERAMPDFEITRKWLAEKGAQYRL